MVARRTKGSFEVSKFPLQWTCSRHTGLVILAQQQEDEMGVNRPSGLPLVARIGDRAPLRVGLIYWFQTARKRVRFQQIGFQGQLLDDEGNELLLQNAAAYYAETV